MNRLFGLVAFLLTLNLNLSTFAGVKGDYGLLSISRPLTLGLQGSLVKTIILYEPDINKQESILKKRSLEMKVNGFTAIVSNIIDPSVVFYPTPIFGVGLGSRLAYSFMDSQDVKSCGKTLSCTGLTNWSYLYLVLQAEYMGLSLRSRYKLGPISKYEASSSFMDGASLLISPEKGSDLQNIDLVINYSLDKSWSIGSFIIDNRMIKTSTKSSYMLGYVNYLRGDWNYFLALGTFSSPLLKDAKKIGDPEMDFTIMFIMYHEFDNSNKVHLDEVVYP